MRRRVVITGIGAVTPLGNDVPSTWKGICEGRSGIGKITHFDASLFPSRIAGEVKELDFAPWVKRDPALGRATSNTRFALAACDEAVRDSGLDWGKTDRRRAGIYFAAGDAGADIDPLARVFRRAFNGSEEFNASKYLAESLKEKGFEVDRRCIHINQPIKKLGAYKVPCQLMEDVRAELNVAVVTEV